MSSAPSQSSTAPAKSAFACVRCAERKVKCDRQRPCGACVNHKVDCVFQPPRPRRKDRHAKEQILADKLKYYETLLQGHGVDPTKLLPAPGSGAMHQDRIVVEASNASQLQTPSSIASEASGSVSKAQVIHGQGRSMFVDNLWSRVVEEFQDSEDVLEDSSDGSNDPEESENDAGFVLSGRPKSKTKLCHPPPKQILELWQIFIENIDPMTKVLHVSTLQPAIEKAVDNVESVPRSFEALMFAIYSTATMSLNDEDCISRLGNPRKILLSQYIASTRIALARARFMGTTSLVVLQALILHILSVRDTLEPRAIWSLTGVAVRIAQGLGLERDGIYLGLSPFESEIRRRIWWLLRTHDSRAAELCGLHKFRDLDIGPESTKVPTNVNDDQIYPSMSSLPPEPNSLTDMAFVSLRYDLVNIAAGRVAKFRQQGKNMSQWDSDLASGSDKLITDQTLREIEGLIEMKYLRYCDPSQPLHLMIMLMGRCSMNTIRFLTHHPRRWASIDQTPLSERQWVWEVCVKLLEQHHMLQSNPQLKRFAWQASSVMQWHAFIHVLDSLRANPLIEDSEKAWQLIGSTYQNNPAMIFDTRRPIHVAVGGLCLKAYAARATSNMQNKNASSLPVPVFIVKLRQHREATRMKKEARNMVNRPAFSPPSLQSGTTGEMDANSRESLNPTRLDPTTSLHEPRTTRIGESDPFWFMDSFDGSHVDSLNSVLATNQDVVPDSGNKDKDDDFGTITWEQWDAWLADPMFPAS